MTNAYSVDRRGTRDSFGQVGWLVGYYLMLVNQL